MTVYLFTSLLLHCKYYLLKCKELSNVRQCYAGQCFVHFVMYNFVAIQVRSEQLHYYMMQII